ncbi:MAG: TonB-dependent receptor [Bryobacterales bacterium]|nr:TonB-dependent receptor [Bryobacterales bacterium]
MHNIRTWLLLALIVACVAVPASAQSMAGLGAINGTVKDASGAVVPGAKVIVSNPNNGIRRSLETNESGLFSAPSLSPAAGYEISAAKEGFAAWELKNIQVQVGQNVSINITMDVKAQAQEINITDSTPLVDALKTGISQVVNDAQIQNLPINGRRVDSFVLLTPGVTNDGTFGLVTFRGIPGGNAYLTDGNDTTQGYYNENAGRTRISSNLGQDAVQEFQVQSSGFTAEFGRSVGGTVNTVTKSGTNGLHGTAYWFFRNQDFNARDRYASVNPDEKRNQFGGSLGGPIKKDKLFYFANVELSRRNFPLVSTAQNPQLFTPGGVFIGTCAAPATAAQCTNAVNYFSRYFGILPRTADQNTYFAKLDWRPNENNSISLSGNIMNWSSPNGIQTQAVLTNAGGIGNNGDSNVRHRFARLAYTGIFSPTLVNEARIGFFKDRLFDGVNPELAPPNGLKGQLSVQGQGNLGVAAFLPRTQPNEDRWQFADNLTWMKGKHNVKFGFDFANTKDVVDILNNGRGTYSYANFTNFALDLTNVDGGKRWQSFSQTFGGQVFTTTVRDYNFYVQDQYRVSSRLTLNYGVRYEYAQFTQPGTPNPDYPLTGQLRQPGKNFAPRIGFAYSTKDAKTVIRGGYGIFYARMPGAMVDGLQKSTGLAQKSISLQGTVAADLAAGPSFPNFMPTTTANPPAGSVSIGFADPNLATPYTQQWDLGIERQLARDMGITVSYLGSRGLKFFSVRDLNLGAPGPAITYRINDAAGTQVGTYSTPGYLRANRVDSRYQRVTMIDNGNRMWYDAMVVQFRKKASRWAEGTVAYTLSHSRDYNQGGGGSNLFFDSLRTVFNGDYRGEKATSELDQRHRLVMTGLFTMPTKKSDNFAVKQFVNGWNLSILATVASSQYTTPTLRVNGTPFTGAAFNTTLNGFGANTRVPFEVRTGTPIDSIARMDARLGKVFGFGERMQLQANFEAFNVFNHVSNTSVFTEAYQLTSGVIRPVPYGGGSASQGFPDGTNARRAQFSLRFIF